MMSNQEDRRRFFRIDDTLGVAYTKMNETENIPDAKQQNDLFRQLASYDRVLAEQLSVLQTRDPVVAKILDALNQKLIAVVNQLEMDNYLVRSLVHKAREVNVSACGMAFYTEDTLQQGDHLHLELALLPSNTIVSTMAKVVDVVDHPVAGESMAGELMVGESVVGERGANENRYVRMDFFAMNTQDQELLIQHLVKRQGQKIREGWDTSGGSLPQSSSPEDRPS
ncbi:hypothetical protein [Marinibactrum halimedae]|uniref:PilZ domain-containing protein n=1 Tax=Marinibactrum halimedae TaxID=1444977 RepID=A0AA37T6E8_9GAMM|nr:hypothetical protein [Marinibactrum halimedae]MCD9461019.1 hypothetical protein [Marinibactrum halimedae]GLS27795.1 hypothetical protein GCM10007877_35140 [Marinibactrum halimedae]